MDVLARVSDLLRRIDLDGQTIVASTNSHLIEGFIRLFKILPGGGGLELDLKDYLISRKPKYVTLSYVWGSNDNKRIIKCNGTPLKVTRNLHEGLLAVRNFLRDDDSLVWADAICINQADDSEKGNSVLQMHRIFGDARAVVVFLGANTDNIEAVFGQLQGVAQVLSTLNGLGTMTGETVHQTPTPNVPIAAAPIQQETKDAES